MTSSRSCTSAPRRCNYAHSRGVIHRDIKPSNIMLTTDSDVRIIDFGIALVADSEISQHRGHRGQPQLHVARAGAVARDHQPLRPVLARRGDVRAADRLSAVPRRQPLQAPAPDRVRDARRRFTRCARTFPRTSRTSVAKALQKDPDEALPERPRFRRRAHARAPEAARRTTSASTARNSSILLRASSSSTTSRTARSGKCCAPAPGRTTTRARRSSRKARWTTASTSSSPAASRWMRHGKAVGQLDSGDCFGETSYVRGAKRLATIKARRRSHA